jgi:cellulose synthase operon protein C
LKCFLNSSRRCVFCRRAQALTVAVVLLAFGSAITAMGELPSWMRNIEASSALEAVFFRMMSLPSGAVLFRRPPGETRPALSDLIKAQPQDAELYSLRALEDEQQLDFAAAESDWKTYGEKSADKVGAQLALADFYHRRLRPADEIKTLSLVAKAAPLPAEKLTPLAQQRSWQAFERVFSIIQAQGMAKEVSIAHYRAWIARYPQEQSLYLRFLHFLVAQKEYSSAGHLIADYQKQFPDDRIFPVKAKAMVEYRNGSAREGLAVYEQEFQPLWEPDLVKSYFDLLRETHNLRKFLDQARASLNANPEDLTTTARIFYYYQQQGKVAAAQQAIADLRLHKEASKSSWSSQQLYICARLLEDIHAYPEAARYYFALYNSKGRADAQELAIAGLTNILLTAPETPIRLGSGELSMYRDIATMDQGPGYLNGILSLILNTTQPSSSYTTDEQRAIPYFHRSEAVELLALLDAKAPNSVRRAELHAKLIDFYAATGETDAVIQGGREFLTSFPAATQRTDISLVMADAYSRKNDTASEFAIYDATLQELADRAQNMPLGPAEQGMNASYGYGRPTNRGEAEESGQEIQDTGEHDNGAGRRPTNQAFQVSATPNQSAQAGARSDEYARVLERYLARLVQLKQIPQALVVLRREIDRNPNAPGLYERLAMFLDQNQLGAEQEEIYRRAISRFPDRTWYDRLARYYLRHKRDSDFEQLTREAVKSFSGSELERYFYNVGGGGPVLYLRLNQYANQRFPHNPIFVRNLLTAYRVPATRDPGAWEALLRQHWFEEDSLRDEFFEFLSRNGKLESELTALRQSAPDAAHWTSNPAAADFLANGELWRSHFEESAPILRSLVAQYPAEFEMARTASSVYRSLAYSEPADTVIAARMEENLLQVNPGNAEILARVGDIYADHDQFAQAASYWERIPEVSPGEPSGYLDAATIYWDYYDFDSALRLLSQGRERLVDRNLFSYEAGAIYENKRDYPHAIEEYVKGALTDSADSPAERRLLALAHRPKFRDMVDLGTAKIVDTANPSLPAIYLRVKVLEAQNRKAETEALLDTIVNSTGSLELAEEIENLAQQKALEAVSQHALEKQAELTTDPVNRLQIRYALIQLYESHKDLQSAQKNVETLYWENAKILGVVRSTVDFYWRIKNYPKAISVLLQAAKDAYPELSAQFTFEAARKSTDAKLYSQARELLTVLLKDSPYNGEYLAAMADAYAQAGDDQGLKEFYTQKIALIRSSSVPSDARKTQTATLRRGLIPALTRMKDYTGAVDQYIELINTFPEDDALVTEAALYALRYQRQQQLENFYSKTIERSPRDYRWSMVLARVQTNLENYPAAIETYGKAIAIRPDRVDLYTARVGLEERLMRFDDAVSDYSHICQLAYKDPQWMEKIAMARARQGKTTETVGALKVALIDGRPENASNYFEVARRLESWGMLADARSFAEQGMKTAGPDLLAAAENHAGVKTYIRIMTRLRQHEEAYATLQSSLADASSNLPVLTEQFAKQGIAALTGAQWRERVHQTRIETARNGMASGLEEMGSVVNSYFTPEERLTFAHFVVARKIGMNYADIEKFAIPLAQSAALADQEAEWRFELMMKDSRETASLYSRMPVFADLQRRRGRYAELGSQLEHFAGVLHLTNRTAAWLEAADAYRAAGDQQNELRLLSNISVHSLDNVRQQRLFQLLLAKRPQDLVAISGDWDASGEAAANYVMANGDAGLAHSMLMTRGQHRPPVWTKSYRALAGLYYAEPTAEVNNAFLDALGDKTIGERLANPVDRAQQLAGDFWYYYGSRYGEYLATTKRGEPEDFLPAMLEQSPASFSGYLTLADYYAGAGDSERAIADYNHTLELSPNQPNVYDNLAVAYYKRGNRAEAISQWKQAFTLLSKQLNTSHVPQSFWTDFARTCNHLRARHLYSELKPDGDEVVRSYLRHNGSWLSNALLQPAYAAIGDPALATAWLLDITSAAADPTQILADAVEAPWIPVTQRAAIYQRILQSKQAALGPLTGAERDTTLQSLGSWQMRWISYLVRTKQYALAADAITSLSNETRDAQATALVPLELLAAAQIGTLDSRIAEYRAEPQTVPDSKLLRSAARRMFEAGDKQSARKILEFVFAHEIDEHQLSAANFLGLAEIRLASGETPGALDLLRRLVATVGNPFENLDPAAGLLEKTGHHAESIEFLDQLVKSAPWDAGYRLRLAKAQVENKQNITTSREALVSIASAPSIPYDLRIKAASALADGPQADLGSGELNLLAGKTADISATAADKFYFYEARIKAAQNAADLETKFRLLNHCIIDFPRRDDPRVPLFQVAATRGSDEFAVGILEPLLRVQFLGGTRAPSRAVEFEEEQIVSSGDDGESESEGDAAAIPGAQPPKLSRAQQAQLAQLVGETMERLDRLPDALSYFELARRFEDSPAARKESSRKIASLKATLRRQQQNAARQPLLHEALEQDRMVRPRLLARVAPGSKAATNKGNAKP